LGGHTTQGKGAGPGQGKKIGSYLKTLLRTQTGAPWGARGVRGPIRDLGGGQGPFCGLPRIHAKGNTTNKKPGLWRAQGRVGPEITGGGEKTSKKTHRTFKVRGGGGGKKQRGRLVEHFFTGSSRWKSGGRGKFTEWGKHRRGASGRNRNSGVLWGDRWGHGQEKEKRQIFLPGGVQPDRGRLGRAQAWRARWAPRRCWGGGRPKKKSKKKNP